MFAHRLLELVLSYEVLVNGACNVRHHCMLDILKQLIELIESFNSATLHPQGWRRGFVVIFLPFKYSKVDSIGREIFKGHVRRQKWFQTCKKMLGTFVLQCMLLAWTIHATELMDDIGTIYCCCSVLDV